MNEKPLIFSDQISSENIEAKNMQRKLETFKPNGQSTMSTMIGKMIGVLNNNTKTRFTENTY